MAPETLNGTLQLTRLMNESADYAARRDELRLDSTISVFTRDPDGTLRHAYSAHPWMAEDIKERGIDWYATLVYADGPR